MIVIFSTNIVYPTLTAYIYITNGTTPFMYTKGGLSMEGDLQTTLDAMEAELYSEAAASGTVPTAKEQAKAERLVFLLNNPNAKAIFELSAADVETQISALVEALFPAATGVSAANKTKLKRVLTVGILVNRESVAGE